MYLAKPYFLSLVSFDKILSLFFLQVLILLIFEI